MKISTSLRKRGLALFLVLTMCMSLLPTSALAAGVAEANHTCNKDGWTCSEAIVCEIPQHTHGDGTCVYAQCQIPEHNHAETGCTQNEDGSWACGLEEHSHADDVPVCTLEEHTHQDGVCQFPATHIPPTEAVSSFLATVKAIPQEVTAADGAVIANARTAYDRLTEAEQANASVVTALGTLEAAEAALAEAGEDVDTGIAGEDSLETFSLAEPVEIDPAALVEMNGEEGAVSLYGLFALASQAGWYEGWLDPGMFLAELTLEYAGGEVETIDFAPYTMQDDVSAPVELAETQVYYYGEAVTVYAGAKAEEIPEEQTPETLKISGTTSIVVGKTTPFTSDRGEDNTHRWYSDNGAVASVTSYTGGTAEVTAYQAGTAKITHEWGWYDYWGNWHGNGKETKTVTVTGSGTAYGSVSFNVYYIYSNSVPAVPHDPGNANAYGPGGDNTPLTTITVDIDRLIASYSNKQPSDLVGSNGNNWYITYLTCGYSADNIADWWSNVLDHANGAEDKLNETGIGKGFQGYVLKMQNDGGHCDGTLTQEPPVYTVELYWEGKLYQVLVADGDTANETTITMDQVKDGYTDSTDGVPGSFHWDKMLYQDVNGTFYSLVENGNDPTTNSINGTSITYRQLTAGEKDLPYYIATFKLEKGTQVVPSYDPATITVNKVDEKGQALAGATFGLYSNESCTTLVGQAQTTAGNGQATFSVSAPGTYWIKETQAPEGYQLNSQAQSVTVPVDSTAAGYPQIGNETVTYKLADPAAVTVTNTRATYDVVYNGNGGTWMDSVNSQTITTNVDKPHTVGQLGDVGNPDHADQGGKKVFFIGWTETEPTGEAVNKVYSFGETYPPLTTKTSVNEATTFYAVWGEDANGNGTPDVYDAKIIYQVEGGTWSDHTAVDQPKYVALKKWDTTANAWVNRTADEINADRNVPTGMQPLANYTSTGANWYSVTNGTASGDVVNPAVQSLTAGMTYTFRYVFPGKTVLTLTATPYSGVYDGQHHIIGVTAKNGNADFTLTAGMVKYYSDEACTTEITDYIKVDTYKNVTDGDVTVYAKVVDGNYTSNVASSTVTITPKPLTVNAQATDRAYNGTVVVDVTNVAIADGGVISGDNVSLSSTPMTGTMENANAGNNKSVNIGTLNLTGKDAGNYTVSQGTVTVNISKVQLTPVLEATDKEYDGTPTATGTVTLNGAVNNERVAPATGYTVAFADKNVAWDNSKVADKVVTASGITLSDTDAVNYELTSTTATDNAMITPRPLTVTAIGDDRLYKEGDTSVDVTIGALTGKVSGQDVVSNDDVSVDGLTSGKVTGTVATADVGNDKPVTVGDTTGSVTLSLTGEDAGNYTLEATTATVTIGGAVTYNANTTDTVTGMPETDNGPDGKGYALNASIKVSDAAPTRVNYTFVGWSMTANGEAMTDVDEAALKMEGNGITLYAVWSQDTYTVNVTYKLLNGTGEVEYANYTGDDVTDAQKSATVSLPNGWSVVVGGTNATINAPGTVNSNYVYDADATLALNPLSGSAAAKNKTVNVTLVYALDVQGSNENGTESGDLTPDYRQVFVKFESADTAAGEVTGTGTYQKFDLTKDAEGKYAGAIHPVNTNITTNGLSGNTFAYWTRDNAEVNPFPKADEAGFPVTGGQTITFDAHFAQAATIRVVYQFLNADGDDKTVAVKEALGDEAPADITVNTYVGASYDVSSANQPSFTTGTGNDAVVYKFVTDSGKAYNGTVTAEMLDDKGVYTITRVYQPDAVRSYTVEKKLTEVNGESYTGGNVKSGDVLTYTITVTNDGNVTLKEDLVLTDSFNGYGEFKDVTGATYAEGAFTIALDAENPLAVNDEATIEYTYKVDPQDAGSMLTNTVVLTPDDPTNPKAEVMVDELTYSVTKELVIPTADSDNAKLLKGVTVEGDKLVIDPDAESITLLYKITVIGDAGANYAITDTGAAVVSGSLTGKLDGKAGETGRTAEILVTMEFDRIEADGVVTYVNSESGSVLSNSIEAKGGEGTKDPENPKPEAKSYTVTVKYIADDETELGVDDYTVIVPAGGAYDVQDKIPEDIVVGKGESAVNYAYDTYVSSAAGLADDDVDPMGVESAGLTGTANSDILIVAVYSKDEVVDPDKKDPSDPEKPGDGIPDKYQATVRFKSADETMGTVTAEEQVFTFVDGEGNYATSGTVTPVLEGTVEVSPIPENQFAYWTMDDGSDAVDPEAELTGIAGGTTIVFCAHFATVDPTPDTGASATLEGTGWTWVYDGRAHRTTASVNGVEGYVIEYSVDGESWTAEAPTVTNVSEGAKTVSVRATKTGYETLETSYTIAITPRTLTITTPSASRVYNGLALTAGPATIDGLVNGETATVTATGSQTAIGSSSNTCSPITWGTAVASNYTITERLGTLTVTAATTPPPFVDNGGGGTTIPDTPTPTTDGTDIEDNDVPLAAPGLNSVDHFDYIKGYGDGTVRPNAFIKRSEVATIFFRLMTEDFRSENWATENDFSDVAAGSWYNNAVSTAASAGILGGYPDGSFQPDREITRAEFAAIAARFASDVVPKGGMFADIEGHWAQEDIERAAAAGWIQGSNGLFRPNDKITRAEAITLINRMLDRVPDEEFLLEDMITFSDNEPGKWYYADIQEATNSHDYERGEMGVTEVWTELLAAVDWTALEKEWATAATTVGVNVGASLTGEDNTEGEGEAMPEETTGDGEE